MAFYLSQRRGWRHRISRNPTIPGLDSSTDMAAYLWDLHIAALAADNYAVEVDPGATDSLHHNLLALCGVPLGEYWFLEALAADCVEDGVFEFLLTSAPLNKLGGAGSPANALALK
jgi:hypothetical protein